MDKVICDNLYVSDDIEFGDGALKCLVDAIFPVGSTFNVVVRSDDNTSIISNTSAKTYLMEGGGGYLTKNPNGRFPGTTWTLLTETPLLVITDENNIVKYYFIFKRVLGDGNTISNTGTINSINNDTKIITNSINIKDNIILSIDAIKKFIKYYYSSVNVYDKSLYTSINNSNVLLNTNDFSLVNNTFLSFNDDVYNVYSYNHNIDNNIKLENINTLPDNINALYDTTYIDNEKPITYKYREIDGEIIKCVLSKPTSNTYYKHYATATLYNEQNITSENNNNIVSKTTYVDSNYYKIFDVEFGKNWLIIFTDGNVLFYNGSTYSYSKSYISGNNNACRLFRYNNTIYFMSKTNNYFNKYDITINEENSSPVSYTTTGTILNYDSQNYYFHINNTSTEAETYSGVKPFVYVHNIYTLFLINGTTGTTTNNIKLLIFGKLNVDENGYVNPLKTYTLGSTSTNSYSFIETSDINILYIRDNNTNNHYKITFND